MLAPRLRSGADHALAPRQLPPTLKMAKTPAKKAAKVAKAAATTGDKKKKRSHKRTESYNIYIYKVLKQVHPGAWRRHRCAVWGGWRSAAAGELARAATRADYCGHWVVHTRTQLRTVTRAHRTVPSS